MRIEVYLAILIILVLMGCDSVDPPKRAFDIEFCSWYGIKISSNDQYFHDSQRFINKQTATELIIKYFKHCLPEANVLLDIRFRLHIKNYETEILNVEQWLNSFGIKRITFWQCSISAKTLIRDCNDGVIKIIEKDNSEFKNATLEQKWNDVLLDNNELLKLYEISKKESFETIGPIIIDILFPDNEIIIFYSDSGPPNWRDETQSMSFRKKRMAAEIWSYFLRGHKDDDITNTVLKLLKDAKTDIKKTQLILTLMFHQWNSECEKVLSHIACNNSEKYDIRNYALQTLLKRCDTESYIPFCFDVIFMLKDKIQRCSAFHDVTQEINNFSKLKKENANLIIRSGFRIITDLEDKDLKHGYLPAGNLGSYLKIKNGFKPDLYDEKYKGENHKYFFIDTVKNALKWWNENQSRYYD